jgi:hypothetical protein
MTQTTVVARVLEGDRLECQVTPQHGEQLTLTGKTTDVEPTGHLPAYLCCSCGTPTLPCAAKDCDHMAVRKRGPVRLPRFCAEHRHEIPGFEKASDRLDSLARYEEVFEYEQSNLSRASKLVGVGATALAAGMTGGLAAAPAVGGAVGTAFSTYSGAAATSYGLALLGGGSVAPADPSIAHDPSTRPDWADWYLTGAN